MGTIAAAGLVVLAVLVIVGWLGGGRKWAFRILLSALLLAVVVGGGILLYVYSTDRAAEHRRLKIHECGIAKVATAKCVQIESGPWKTYQGKGKWDAGKQVVWDDCPGYKLPENPTPEQEETAVSAAEAVCIAELEPKQNTHEEISRYKHDHGIKDDQKTGDVFDRAVAACAAKVRKSYPNDYNDLDDATLTKKVLAKYPNYCDVTTSPPDFIPDIQGIR